MNLSEYHKKRDFTNTPEPSGEASENSDRQRFVIQRHAARRLHYDLRLEIDGALKSWAVPKGPSMNPADKRLAVRTEDHPVSYLTFHGTIPKGNYGAGEMRIWDSGIFNVDTDESQEDLGQQLNRGNLKIIFHGNKILGRFALVRTGIKSGKEQWLLIKKKDAFSLNGLYDAESFQNSTEQVTTSRHLRPGLVIKPMLAGTTKKIFNKPDWIFELKWDGYRVLAHISPKGVLIQSRNGINYNTKFNELHKELERIDHDVILDGEVVILDEKGVSQFAELQNYPDSEGVLCYYVFDMLYLNGHSMLDLGLLERKSLIKEVIEGLNITRYCDHIEGMGAALFEKALEMGMEGIMAKASASRYAPGFRTEKWLKVKSVQSMDAYVCGFTKSENNEAFGSLILGSREKRDPLRYIGNCGTGFGATKKQRLLSLFSPYIVGESPFGKSPDLKGRKPIWMQPFLLCEVTYSEKTKNKVLRHPVFKRIINADLTLQTLSLKTNGERRSKGKANKNSATDFVTVDGIKVPVSNLDKMYWPNSKKRKYDLIDYYLNISEYILPHLQHRPQSLHRHPDGIHGEDFYQKDNPHLPDWVETMSLYSKSSEREINYLICQNTATLLYMANLGCIEIHPWNSRIQSLDRPDYGIIDLDPPEHMVFSDVRKVALAISALLDEITIQAYYKVSGSKGIHIYLPMGAKYNYGEVRNFIKLICLVIQQRKPSLTTLERTIKKRNGKIYLDYLQNRKGQTVASAHSVRPLEGAPISAPISMEELQKISGPKEFSIKDYPSRLNVVGDIFKPLLTDFTDIEQAIKVLENIL